MPPTRSKKINAQSKAKSKAKGKSTLNIDDDDAPPTTNVGEDNPRGDSTPPNTIKYTFERVRGDTLGSVLKEFYCSKVQPEFSQDTSFDGVEVPQTSRPPPISLKNLECIRTLGICTSGRVLLASSERSKDRSQTGQRPLFAVKAVRRKAYRKDISKLPAQDESVEGNNLAEVARHHFESQSKERSTLAELPWNPFIAGLIQTFQDSQALYMALEFLPGGTLRSLLRRSPNGLGHQSAFFYFGNIVCGLDFLREEGIAHRNLCPDSILLGGDGYLSLSNFEDARMFGNNESTWSMVRREYVPPECRSLSGTGTVIVPEAIDWWSSGCILFEMATGEMASFEEDELEPQEAYRPHWPQTITFGENLVNLVHSLLAVDPLKRLGTEGVIQVKKHPWFSGMDWSNMKRRGYPAPYIPKPIDQSQLWHDLPLPKQEYIPGLKILNPYLHLAHDNRFPERPASSV